MFNQKGDKHISIWLGKKEEKAIGYKLTHTGLKCTKRSHFFIYMSDLLTIALCLFERGVRDFQLPISYITGSFKLSIILRVTQFLLGKCSEFQISSPHPSSCVLPLLSSKGNLMEREDKWLGLMQCSLKPYWFSLGSSIGQPVRYFIWTGGLPGAGGFSWPFWGHVLECLGHAHGLVNLHDISLLATDSFRLKVSASLMCLSISQYLVTW